MAKHTFRKRGTADVAETDEQNFQLFVRRHYYPQMKRVLPVLLLLACSPASEESAATADDDLRCENAQRIAALPPGLREASGLAVSRRNPGILWVHNDSGDPILYALDTLGNLRGRVHIQHASNDDWEDIAVGDCDAGSCLYIGAIGDNLQNSTDRVIYRVPEPEFGASSAQATATFRYRFSGQPHDTEALFAIGEQLYLITKGRSGAISLYRVPMQGGEPDTLQLLQELTPGLVQLPDMVTAAGVTPDGKYILIRTYSALQLYSFEGERLQPALPASGFDLQPLNEFQGEGADITAAGVVYLVSEKGLEDRAPPLSKVLCRLPR